MRGKAQRVARPALARLQNPGVTEPKLTEFLSDVQESSTVLMRASDPYCDPAICCGMPVHRMKLRYANSLIRAKHRLP